MHLTVLGINHTTAPVGVRGKVAFPPEQLHRALAELIALEGVREAVILSTCNRTELYCAQDQLESAAVVNWLCRFHDLCADSLQEHFYTYADDAAVRHALRVASGLDSLILGEPQILGQMKTSYQTALEAGSVDSLINRLFQHTFSVAKQIRTDTAIGASPVSVAFAAVRLALQIFGSLEKHTALLIGAGETIELTARHLHEQGIGKIIITNRTAERAHALAAQFNGFGIGLDEISGHLPEADIVISSTGSSEVILDRETVAAALKGRKHRPVFMVDIAVPGDIAADVAELDDIYLYTVDDLRQVIEENQRSRRQAAKQAEEIIEAQVDHFTEWTRSLHAVPTLRAYREYADAMGHKAAEKAIRQLDEGMPPKQVVELLTHTLINKLTHDPTVNLRAAVADGNTSLLDAVRALFKIGEKNNRS